MAKKIVKDEIVSFFHLFNYASKSDVWLTVFSLVSAISTGICLPVLIILFGKVTESFISEGLNSHVNTSRCNVTYINNLCQGELLIAENEKLTSNSLMEDVIIYCVESTAVGIISLSLHFIFITFINLAANNQAHRMKLLLFMSVMRQDIACHDQRPIDFLSQSTNNIRKIEESIGEKLALFVYYSSAFVACTITALYNGWELTMIILSPLPLLITATYFLSKHKARFMLQEFDANWVSMANVKEVMESLRTVVAFGGQQKEVQRFRQDIKPIESAIFRRSLLSGMEAGLWWLLTFVSYALAFWYGVEMVFSSSFPTSNGKKINEGKFKYTVSTFNIVFFNVFYAGTKISELLSLTEIFTIGKVAATSVFMTIGSFPTIQISKPKINCDSARRIQGQVEFDQVRFTYPSRPDVPVLKGISFTVPPKKVIALVGPSGCGKTTCLQLIQRFYEPFQGVIRLDGVPLQEYDPVWLRQHIGIVGQEPVLFATTIKENIQLGHRFHGKEQKELMLETINAARQAHAHEFIQSFPLGYDTLIGENGTQLSGGQKQCIAIARALMGNPKVLLLDEPTSALDILSEAQVQKALKNICRGRTCFIIAHRMKTVRKADCILVLRDGFIAESGSHDTLMAKEGLYYNLVTTSNSTGNEIPFIPKSLPDGQINTDSSNSDLLQNNSTGLCILGDDGNRREDFKIYSSKKSWNWVKEFIGLNRELIPFIVFGILGSIITGLCQPVFAILFGETLNILTMATHAKSEVSETKIQFLIAFLVIAVIASLAGFIQTFTLSMCSNKLSLLLRISSYQSILSQEINWFDKPENNVGALCTRLIDDPLNIQEIIGLRTGAVIQGLSSLILSLALAFYYQWKLALVGCIFVPILLLMFVIDSKIGMTQNSVVEKKCNEDSNRLASETFSNIRTVVGLCKQEYFYKIYKDLLTKGRQSFQRKAVVRGLVCAWACNLDTLSSIAFIYYGGYLVQNEAVTIKSVFTVAESLIYGMENIGKNLALMPSLSKACYSATSFRTLLRTRICQNVPVPLNCQHIDDDSEISTQRIKFENVRFSYPIRPNVPVLQEFNVIIEPGQTVALVGPSGSGKSTTIQLLQRFYDPDQGTIQLNNCCLSNFPDHFLRFQLGLVSQEPVLFNRTIAENISYGDNTRQPLVEELFESARQANIHDWIQSLPKGYETIVGYRGNQLSGGQKQRVAIARALIRQPRILILDEATSALDSESEHLVQQALNKAKVGRTCIVISHRLRSISNADCILVLNEGRIQEQGTHQQLIELGGLYYKLFISERSD